MKIKQSLLLAISILLSIYKLPAQDANTVVEKVHIIFKTHLDVGFTELSSVVEQRYIDEFIPKAIEVAEELRESGRKERYVWTTGSWLIWSFIEQAPPEQVKKLEQAIMRGDIAWNGVPYTVESEIMNKAHFEAILKLSKQLDKRFGKNTTAAKMTDVPGHTRSIVPLLSNAGIKFLHIGVNPASTIPNVPDICRWQDTDGSEIVLMYQKDYGSDIILPDGKTAMVVVFTGDNHGPHNAKQVIEAYAQLQNRYPNAELKASTLSDIATDIEKMKENLPIVTSEIGDTWIHGYGSSPVRMARYRAMIRLYAQWVENGQLDPDSSEAEKFTIRLGLIPEHTWGLDVKTHLQNWDKYNYDKFQQARSLPAFQKIEASWREVDQNVDKAIEFLPAALQIEAKKEIAKIGNPIKQNIKGKKNPDEITANGALQINNNGLKMIAGELVYQSFSKEDFDRFQSAYVTHLFGWAISDFGKPGLENSNAKSASLKATVQHCDTKKSKAKKETAYSLKFIEDERVDTHVLPEDIYTNYSVDASGKNIDLSITIINKPANRLPEAYWYSFIPENITGIIAEKIGREVNVIDVVEGGNRQMHGIDRYVDIITTNGRVRIKSYDAPLVAIGERSVLNYSTKLPDIKNGVHFCLFNNVWGTNFSMWFEGSLTYRFKIELMPEI